MSGNVKQFTGGYKKRKSFDRKVMQSGNSRTIALTKVIPEEWKYVRITILNRTPTSVELLLELLYKEESDAQAKTNDKRGE